MVKKGAKHLYSVLGTCVFIGFCVQILLGCIWMEKNLFSFQEFGKSYFLLEVGESLVCDEYTGWLYPFLLMICNKLFAWMGKDRFFAVYALQLGVAGYHGYFLVKSLFFAEISGKVLREKKRFLSAWGSLALLCVPQMMQCHLAILPQSLAVSALFWELSSFFFMRSKERKKIYLLLRMGIAWILQILLIPEYMLFGGILLGIGFITYLAMERGNKRIIFLRGAVTILLVVAIAVGIRNITVTPGAYGKATPSVRLNALDRFAGNCLEDLYGYWPEDLKACFDEEELRHCFTHAENVKQVFGKIAQDKLGKKRADEVFEMVAKAGYDVYYVKQRHDLIWDLAAYVAPPVFLQLQLQDRGCPSYTGRNYDVMRMHSPKITKWYVDYGSFWFVAGMGLSALGVVLCRMIGRVKGISKGLVALGTFVALGCCMVFWYTLQGAGQMDYLNTVPGLMFLGLFAMKPAMDM